MRATLKVIRDLSATTSRKDKEQILYDAWYSGERVFFEGAKLCYDKLISFGVAKVPVILEDDGSVGTFTIDDFRKLADDLYRRRLTGNDARDALRLAAENCNTELWNLFYRRVLLKDLDVGVELKTINKVLKNIGVPETINYVIPVFSPQLAQDGLDEANQKHLKGKKYIDLKLDGTRCVTILDKETNTVKQYTREGRLNENFPHITSALADLLPHLPGSIMLDGEMTARSYQELMQQLNRKNASTESMNLVLFDIVPLRDFKNGYCPISQKDRHETLITLTTSDLFINAVKGKIFLNPKILIDLDTPEGWETLNEFRRQTLAERDAGEAFKEGVMIKDVEAGYVTERTNAWLKMKPLISVSLTVVDLERGKPDGKFANSLGGLVCEGYEDGKFVRVVVGGGITEQERQEWWNDPSLIKGYIVEIEADKLTKPKNGDIWSLRHPRFKGKRGTMPGEKM